MTAMSAAARADANRRRRCAIAASLRAHDAHQLAQSASFAVASSAVTRLESIGAILFVVVRFAVFVVVAAIAAAFAGVDCRLVAAFYGIDVIVAEDRRKIVDIDRFIVAAVRRHRCWLNAIVAAVCHRRLAAIRRRRLDAIVVVGCGRWLDTIVVAKCRRRLVAVRHRRLAAVRRRRLDAIVVVGCGCWLDAIVAAIRHRRLAAIRRRRLDAIVVVGYWRRLDAIGTVAGNDRYVGMFI